MSNENDKIDQEFKEVFGGAVPHTEAAPKVFRLELSEASARALRHDLEPLIVRNMLDGDHSSVLIANTALAHFGLRFEHGFFVPEGHYLDLVHSQIVPEGKHIDPASKEIVETPDGVRYDRKNGRLVS